MNARVLKVEAQNTSLYGYFFGSGHLTEGSVNVASDVRPAKPRNNHKLEITNACSQAILHHRQCQSMVLLVHWLLFWIVTEKMLKGGDPRIEHIFNDCHFYVDFCQNESGHHEYNLVHKKFSVCYVHFHN